MHFYNKIICNTFQQWKNLPYILPCWLGLKKTPAAPLLRGKPMRPPVGCWWQPVIPEDGIQVASQTKWSHDLQHFTLALTRRDEWGLIQSIGQSCQVLVHIWFSTMFFKLFLRQTPTQPPFILEVQESSDRGSIALWYQYLKPFKLCVNKWLI